MQDHIFEVEEISLVEGDLGLVGDPSRVPSSPVQCGSVEVGFDYDAAARKMTVHIIQVRGVPPKDIGGANNTQVCLLSIRAVEITLHMLHMSLLICDMIPAGSSSTAAREKAKT